MEIRWLSAVFDFPADDFGDEVTFWRAIAGSTVSPPRGSRRQFASLEPFTGDPHLRVQWIETGVGGVHLDIHVDDVEAAASAAEEIGATRSEESPDGLRLLSPAGFTFCMVPWNGEHERSRPIRWPGDTISIIDQICIDVPGRLFDDECAFFTRLTGWELETASRPEFRALCHPDSMPVRILLQRKASGLTDAHVDLASTHPADEVSRHQDWGAEVVAQYDNWTVMADPTGRPYCITARNPRTGRLPDND
ncbi:VOC family protein [Williamsia sp. SKLECPSW1]